MCGSTLRSTGQEQASGGADARQRHRLSCTVTVAPISSTIRGVPSEVVLNAEDGMKAPCAVNLHNAVTVSREQLGQAGGKAESARMDEDLCRAGLLSGMRFGGALIRTPNTRSSR